MSKRKLNRRQKWRIEKIQSEKIERAQKVDKKLSEAYQASDLGDEQTGLVIAHYGQLVDIEPINNIEPTNTELINKDTEKAIHRCHVRANVDSLVTGDVVVWRAGSNLSGVIETRLERKTLLQRPDNYGLLKPVAANIDRIVIVVATEPTPHTNLIDRYLVAAETLNIQPALLFNKADLINDSNREQIESLCRTYRDLGYEVLMTSANEVAHCEGELLAWLKHHTSVLVGQSGVGKSSLIRSILGDQSIKVGELSELSRKGTHTTTTAKLFHIPGGGKLVDSPGIREFGLWHISEDELLHGFIEFRPFIGYCRFRDCKHMSEPKCAILDALENGAISPDRMASYLRIRETLNDKQTYERQSDQ
jgi:ribosome biogenesis GTPase